MKFVIELDMDAVAPATFQRLFSEVLVMMNGFAQRDVPSNALPGKLLDNRPEQQFVILTEAILSGAGIDAPPCGRMLVTRTEFNTRRLAVEQARKDGVQLTLLDTETGTSTKVAP